LTTHSRSCCMTCCAVLFEPWFGNFLLSMAFQEFVDCVDVALRVNCIVKEIGPTFLRQDTVHSQCSHSRLPVLFCKVPHHQFCWCWAFKSVTLSVT
jgi:hypothetical protein